jgi:hypothetical protein
VTRRPVIGSMFQSNIISPFFFSRIFLAHFVECRSTIACFVDILKVHLFWQVTG